jgi:RNA-directed DNA polymerase
MRVEKLQRPRKEATGSRHEPGVVRQTAPAEGEIIVPQTQPLMEEVLRRENLFAALRRVQANKGAPGADGMSVDELPEHLRQAWPKIREQLLSETYVPAPVRAVYLPKPGGGTRMLGIPTALDRLIAQAIVRAVVPTKLWNKPAAIWPTVIAGWCILIWRNFSTVSITTW